MLLTLLGFLLALLILSGLIFRFDKVVGEKLISLVRPPALVPIRRHERRSVFTTATWWLYPIMAPPDGLRAQSRRSHPFRRT